MFWCFCTHRDFPFHLDWPPILMLGNDAPLFFQERIFPALHSITDIEMNGNLSCNLFPLYLGLIKTHEVMLYENEKGV
jgi:hypothetical protein